VSSTTDKKASQVKAAAVIVIAVTGLFAALFAVFSVGMSTTTAKSPMQINEEQILLKRTRELPEVKSFLNMYPNATVEYRSSGGYSFIYERVYPNEGFAQYVALYVVMNRLPDPEDIQTGEQKQHGEYYYYLEFRCGPAGIDDPDRVSFSDRIWQLSDNLCESDRNAMNITVVK
jgi:hypothetical protein